MKVILIRVGMDQNVTERARKLGTDQTVTCNGWNAPVNPEKWEFAYVPILESHKTKKVRPEYEEFCGYEQFKEPCEKVSANATLPPRFDGMCSHLDPDFRFLTYGDERGKAEQLRLWNLGEGDILAFYAALSAQHAGLRDLIYALIGLYVLADDPMKTTEDFKNNQEYWCKNAHTRRYFEDDDIVLKGKEGSSGRLKRCIRIGKRRGKGNQYRLTEDLRDRWGGLWVIRKSGEKSRVNDAWIQRSGMLPCVGNPAAFCEWFSKEFNNNGLVQSNNLD